MATKTPTPPPVLTPRQLAEMHGPERASAIIAKRQKIADQINDPAIQASLARPYDGPDGISTVVCLRPEFLTKISNKTKKAKY